jgi:hypothetical protein
MRDNHPQAAEPPLFLESRLVDCNLCEDFRLDFAAWQLTTVLGVIGSDHSGDFPSRPRSIISNPLAPAFRSVFGRAPNIPPPIAPGSALLPPDVSN